MFIIITIWIRQDITISYNFNAFFYKEIFQNFFSELKKLIDEKYEKYIEISANYHSQIKENEFLIDKDSPEEYKEAIKQSIELLKEDQEHQIGIIEFQYNSLINQKISDFKLTSFKNNVGLQLMEEQLKLDIYHIINDALQDHLSHLYSFNVLL